MLNKHIFSNILPFMVIEDQIFNFRDCYDMANQGTGKHNE